MYDAALRELDRAFQLCRDGVQVDMFSPYIDMIWHNLTDHDGRVKEMGHQNTDIIHVEHAGAGRVAFVEAYEARWGKLPDVWFMDENGDLQSEMKTAYDQFGVIYTSWNCNPSVTPSIDKITDLPTLSDILDQDYAIVRFPFNIPNVPRQDVSIPDAVKKRLPQITPEKRI